MPRTIPNLSDYASNDYDVEAMEIDARNGNFSPEDAVAFRQWLAENGGTVELIGEAFNGPDAFRKTSVRVALIVIDRA